MPMAISFCETWLDWDAACVAGGRPIYTSSLELVVAPDD
jgi:hypothetical protein